MSGYRLHAVPFGEIDSLTAYRLWALRQAVFVVEQQCFYLDLDGRDPEAGTRHVWLSSDEEPVAYLRVLDLDQDCPRIGRVLVAQRHRGEGLAGRLMRAALELIGDRPSRLAAQTYLFGWYTGFGYLRDGDDFLDDGIPHTPMLRPRR